MEQDKIIAQTLANMTKAGRSLVDVLDALYRCTKGMEPDRVQSVKIMYNHLTA